MNNQTSRLIQFLNNFKGKELVAVFDIGTRAARLLIAPAEVPQTEWQSNFFFNTRDISRLGGDVSRYERKLAIGNSESLERAIRFISYNRQILVNNGVKEHNIHAIGTAVFRWLENRTEILDVFNQKAGVDIRVISDQEEAQMSLAGIAFTHDKRPGGPDIKPQDFIVLIDQGGGSTEVSYSSADGKEADLHSFDDFGTVSLRHKFFYLGADGLVEPSTNRRRIVTQLDRISAIAEEKVNQWTGYPNLFNRKLHIYGMGSAITNCFPGMSNFKIHNKVCSINQIEQVIQMHANALDYSREQILTLWKRYKSEEHLIERDEADNLENRLLALYGLPVFITLLNKFNCSELRICGYGLRYAFYLWRYHYRFESA